MITILIGVLLACTAKRQPMGMIAVAGQTAILQEPELQPAADSACYWVYLGQYSARSHTWIRRNFELFGAPERGQQIVALTDLFKWDELPSPAPDGWKMGKIMGLIASSETLMVMRIKKIREDSYWALVSN